MELKTKVNDKKVFAKIGLAILVCMIVVNVIQTIYYSAINVIRPSLLEQPWVNYIAIAISFYFIGFPIFYVMVRKLPDGEKKESKSLSVGKMILLFFMSYAILYVVNFLTTILLMIIAAITLPVMLPIPPSTTITSISIDLLKSNVDGFNMPRLCP